MSDPRLPYIAKLEGGLVSVPATPQPGICSTCRAATNPTFNSCWKCDFENVPPVLPITMSVHSELMHHHLAKYKRDRSTEVRRRHTLRLAALASMFFEIHLAKGCIPEFDRIVTVPSEARDAPRAIVERLKSYSGHPAVLGFREKEGKPELQVINHPGSKRVLLFDDTFTQGGSIAHADNVLRSNSVTVVDRVVLGRHVRLTFPPSKLMIEALKSFPFDINRCGRCSGAVFSPPLREPEAPSSLFD